MISGSGFHWLKVKYSENENTMEQCKILKKGQSHDYVTSLDAEEALENFYGRYIMAHHPWMLHHLADKLMN